MDIAFDVDLKEKNTFGMKVRGACLAEYYSVEELVEILGREDLPRPFFHIGGGSNLLFTGDFGGTVLHSGIRFIESSRSEDGATVRVGAGVNWDEFCGWCADMGLWGPENLSLIPGEVGAAAVQNIGAYGREVQEIISTVECYDSEEKRMVAFSPRECGYGYRESMFKKEGKGRYFVTAVSFRLLSDYAPLLGYGNVMAAVTEACGSFAVQENMLTPSQVRDVVIKIREDKLPDPAETGSAGSFFRNPVVPESIYAKITAAEGEVPHFMLGDGKVKIPAAWLIDRCGWKGFREGNVGVWHKQPLVIVNASGEASPAEVIRLEDRIKASVKDRFGIELSPEVEHIS